MIDIKIPDETKAIRDKVRDFVQSECHPAEESCTAENFDEVLAGLRKTARSQGLWCPFVPEEHGGMGLRPLANALVQMELGESFLGALALNTQGPDDATMLTLLEHGTDFQKEKFLKPLLNGEKRICYSMTEKAAGADATGMQTKVRLRLHRNCLRVPILTMLSSVSTLNEKPPHPLSVEVCSVDWEGPSTMMLAIGVL